MFVFIVDPFKWLSKPGGGLLCVAAVETFQSWREEVLHQTLNIKEIKSL